MYKTQEAIGIAVVRSHDNRAVTLFSTEIAHEPKGTAERWRWQKSC